MKFKELKLSEKILKSIQRMGYDEVTPIQELAIPVILQKKDVIGLAQTGTGKTAAFSLPILDMFIKEEKADKKIKFLIISPTRELAIQIRDNILKYSEETTFKCSVILGGVNQKSQIEVLKKGIDILVATPGRLVDLINQKKVDLSFVKALVLDEADTMLDMGFIKDVKFIIGKTPIERQTLLFSATVPPEVKDLSSNFMKNPITIKTATDNVTADKVEEEVYFVDTKNKINILLDLMSTKEKPTTLVFTRTKHGANKLSDKLDEFNIKASVIHGNKSQANRVRALSDFKTGKTRIMVATDIAARGIDIKDLELVINYDVPEKPELYVHRIGRTARAGKDGKSITLCASSELKDLKDIEKLIGHSIKEIKHKYPMILSEKKPAQGSRNNNASSEKRFEKPFRKDNESGEKKFDRPYKKPFKRNDEASSEKKFEGRSNSSFRKDNESGEKKFDRPYKKPFKRNDEASSEKKVAGHSNKPYNKDYSRDKKYEGSNNKSFRKNNNSKYRFSKKNQGK